MLILQTSHTYPPKVDGVSEVVTQISTRLAARGHEVHVATAAWPEFQREEVINGVHVHRFEVSGDFLSGIRGNVGEYLAFLRSQNWDVIAMHHSGIWTTDVVLEWLKDFHGAKVFVPHGLIRFRYPQFETYFKQIAEKLLYCDAIIGLSCLTEEVAFASKYGLPTPVIIPNGVNPTQFLQPTRDARARWNIGNRPWIVLVGNHNPNKGHRAAFRVMRALRKQVPNAKASVIGGNYPAAAWSLGRLGIKGGCWYRCKLRSLVQRGIELRTKIPREDVISAIQEADLLLVTSKWEASPIMVLESMAAGTPWLSFDVGCVREHAGGLVVASVREMVDTAVALLRNPTLRRELGSAGRNRILERHDWNTIVAEYEKLFFSVSRRECQVGM